MDNFKKLVFGLVALLACSDSGFCGRGGVARCAVGGKAMKAAVTAGSAPCVGGLPTFGDGPRPPKQVNVSRPARPSSLDGGWFKNPSKSVGVSPFLSGGTFLDRFKRAAAIRAAVVGACSENILSSSQVAIFATPNALIHDDRLMEIIAHHIEVGAKIEVFLDCFDGMFPEDGTKDYNALIEIIDELVKSGAEVRQRSHCNPKECQCPKPDDDKPWWVLSWMDNADKNSQAVHASYDDSYGAQARATIFASGGINVEHNGQVSLSEAEVVRRLDEASKERSSWLTDGFGECKVWLMPKLLPD